MASAHGMRLVTQEGSDLGARMDHAIRSHLPGKVCIIGSDSPSLPVELVRQAFAALDRSDLVLGPSGDGGYWLVGATRPAPELFSSIAWGTPAVLPETLRRARGAALLPFWYDVDDGDDLELLRAHLAHLPAEVARATRAALQK